MTTPIYTYPAPILSGVADAPAAFAALTARIEREQTVLRSTSMSTKEVQINIGAAASYAVHVIDFPVSTIGWANVELNIAFGIQDINDSDSFIAGYLDLSIGGTLTRHLRWHNYGRSRYIEKTITGHKVLTAAISSVTVQVALITDSLSSPITYLMSEIAIRQFGAPST